MITILWGGNHLAGWLEPRDVAEAIPRPLSVVPRHLASEVRARRRAQDSLSAVFSMPALRDVELEYAREGSLRGHTRRAPYIDAILAIYSFGYGGNGMTFGFLAARLLLDEFLTLGNQDDSRCSRSVASENS